MWLIGLIHFQRALLNREDNLNEYLKLKLKAKIERQLELYPAAVKVNGSRAEVVVDTNVSSGKKVFLWSDNHVYHNYKKYCFSCITKLHCSFLFLHLYSEIKIFLQTPRRDSHKDSLGLGREMPY